MISVRGLTKLYGDFSAVRSISFDVGVGEILGLVGPNGAGKTTLIRCLAGIAAADRGAIYIDGEEFRRDRMDFRRRMHILPDFPALFWDQSVLRNISIILRLFEADKEGTEDRVVELLRDFDLLPLSLRPVNSLSRGQAYKTALVALIAAGRDLWLLDEPFASGMDPHGIDAFKRHARAAAAQGSIILYSTQLLDVAERFSDRVCVIHKGEIRAFDTLTRLREGAQDKDNVLEELFRQLRDDRE